MRHRKNALRRAADLMKISPNQIALSVLASACVFCACAQRENSGWTTGKGTITIEKRVGIGVADFTSMLAVAGTIRAQEVEITLEDWPGYVFAPDYELMPLEELAQRIRNEGHLPGIPSASAVRLSGGIAIGEMNRLLLEKVEELTLYTIELERKGSGLERRFADLERIVGGGVDQ